MKEVAFRWIDRYLIHITLQEKFYLLFLLPVIALMSVATILADSASQQRIEITTQQLETTASLLSQQQVSQADAQRVLANTNLHVGQGDISAYVSGMNYSISSDAAAGLFSHVSTNQWIIMAAILLISLAAVYYIMTFIGGAMFTTNKALQSLVPSVPSPNGTSQAYFVVT